MTDLSNSTTSNSGHAHAIIAIAIAILRFAYFWVAFLATVIPLITIVATKPKTDEELVAAYFDDETSRFCQTFKITLHFANNPLFPRLRIFWYRPEAKYEVTWSEFGAYDTKVSQGTLEDRQARKWLFFKDKNFREVRITEKSFLRQRKISMLRLEIDNEGGDYRSKIRKEVRDDRVAVFNSNDHEVRDFAVELPNTNFKRLKANHNISYIEQSGHSCIIRIVAVPAMRLGKPGEVTILL